MAVFYNSSAAIQTVSVTNLTIGGLSATTLITGTAQSANTGAIVVTANSTTGANLFSRLVFTNSNGMTFGVSTAANSVVLTVSTAGAIIVTAGGSQGTVSTLVFSNSNGISFGLSTNAASVGTGTITAAYSTNLYSYYNYPAAPLMNTTWIGIVDNVNQTNIVQPFNLPYAISANCIRIPITQSIFPSTSFSLSTATNNTAGSMIGSYIQTHSLYANIYSLGTGTQSTALRLVSAFSFSSGFEWRVSYINSNNSNTYTIVMSYGLDNTTVSTSFSYSNANSSLVFQTSQWTNYTGNRFLDIVATNGISLDEAPYWIAFFGAYSTRTTGQWQTGGTTTLTNGLIFYSHFANTQYSTGFSPVNSAQTAQLKLGQGFWTNGAASQTSATLAFTNIVTNASNIEIPFEMINRV